MTENELAVAFERARKRLKNARHIANGLVFADCPRCGAHDALTLDLTTGEGSVSGCKCSQFLVNTLPELSPDIPVQELYECKGEKTSWLVRDLIPENEITLIAGSRGGMKTYLAWGMAVCIALGETFIGRDTISRKVILIDAENPATVIEDRKEKIGCPEGLSMWSASIHKHHPPPRIDTPQGLAKYLKIAEMEQPNPVFIFDTLSKFHRQDSNSNDAMRAVMAAFRKLTEAHATVIILHHCSISFEGGRPHKSRGASAIEDDVDSVFLMHKLQERGKINLYCEKHRQIFVPTMKLRLTGNSHSMFWLDISDPQETEAQDV